MVLFTSPIVDESNNQCEGTVYLDGFVSLEDGNCFFLDEDELKEWYLSYLDLEMDMIRDLIPYSKPNNISYLSPMEIAKFTWLVIEKQAIEKDGFKKYLSKKKKK